MSRVLISEAISGPALDYLDAEFDVQQIPHLWQHPEQLKEEILSAKALIVRNQTNVTADVLDKAKDLEIVGRAGAGLDNIDVKAASAAGIVVTNTPHHNAVSVAELTLGLVLALARNVIQADRDTRSGGWDRAGNTGIEIYNKTMGIVGFGRIGFLTAMRARALGMQVLAFDPYLDPHSILLTQAGARLLGLDELLSESDVVSCHLPATSDTAQLFNSDRFAAMKPGAFFVNVARGEVVDENALINALQEGRLAGAALDVRTTEPPTPSPLDEMEQVILTPHIGAFTMEAQERVVSAVCRDVAAVLTGKGATNAVNFPAPRRRPASRR